MDCIDLLEKEVRTIARGIARNNPEMLEYLRALPGVSDIQVTGEILQFWYDPEQTRPAEIPAGLSFNLTEDLD